MPLSVTDESRPRLVDQHGDEQHPYDLVNDRYMAHCVNCGTYVEDTSELPATDYLCSDCQ